MMEYRRKRTKVALAEPVATHAPTNGDSVKVVGGRSPLDDLLAGGEDAHGSQARRSILVTLAKYRLRVVLALIVGALLTILWASGARPTYVSQAVLFVRPSSADLLSDRPDLTTSRTLPLNTTEEYVRVQLSLLGSSDVRAQVARRLLETGIIDPADLPDEETEPTFLESISRELGLSEEPDKAAEPGQSADPKVNAVLAFLDQSLNLLNAPRSPLITIECAHQNPRLAQSILREMLDVYEEFRREQYTLTSVSDAIDRDYKTVQGELTAAKERLAEFRAKHGMHAPAPEETMLLARLEALKQSRTAAQLRVLDSGAQARQLRKLLDGMSRLLPVTKTTQANPVWATLMQKRDELKLRLVETEFTPGSFEHKSAVKQLQFIEERLKKENETTVVGQTQPALNPQYAEVERLARASEVEGEAAAQLLTDIEKRMKPIEARLATVGPLKDPYRVLTEDVTTHETRLEERRVARERITREQELVDEKVLVSQKIIQQPTAPSDPESGGPKRRLFIGLGLTLIIGAVVGLLSGASDRTLRSGEDVLTAVGEKPIATIPHLSERRAVRRFAQRYGRAHASGSESKRLGLLSPSIAMKLGRPDLCHGALANQLDRIIKTTVDSAPASEEPIRLVVCGVGQGVGGTTLALSLARRLTSNREYRVLLVDWDYVNPESSRLVGPDSPDAASPIVPTSEPGLDFVGPALREAGPSSFHRLLAAERTTYDVIVYDAGSLLACAETLNVLDDGVAVCVVVGADETPIPLVQEALEIVERTPARLVGTVLNRRRYYLPSWSEY